MGYFAHSCCTSSDTRLRFTSKSSMISLIHCAIITISGSLKPLVVTAGVPMRRPLVMKGLAGSFGIVFLFAVMLTALIWGIIVKRFESSRAKKGFLTGYAVWIIADLIVRILPLSINQYPGAGYQIAGAVVRLLSLGLVLWELTKQRKKQK